MPSVITANLLRSGEVVYLGRDGTWVSSLAEAHVAEDKSATVEQQVTALAAVTRNEVTAVYAIEVLLADGRPAPTSVRERIRAAHAPTV